MLDIRFVRANPDTVKADLKKRNDLLKIPWVDEILQKDARSRKLKGQTDELRRRRNVISREINEARKAGNDTTALMTEAANLPQKIRENDAEQEEISTTIHSYLMRLPNILHDSVPQGKDDTENVEFKRVGTPRTFDFELKNHGQLAADRGWADFERAAKISGAGFYFLKGNLVLLDLALQRFTIDLLAKKGFIPVIPPFMINRSSYEGVTDLDDFEKVMYKIDGDDTYLIATSEHPIGAMYQDEIFEENDLPLRACRGSTLFPEGDRVAWSGYQGPFQGAPVQQSGAVCLLQTGRFMADPRRTAGKCRRSLPESLSSVSCREYLHRGYRYRRGEKI